MHLLLATGNAHKVAELQAILGPSWTVEAHDPGVEETGATFEENALLKARALAASTGELAVADDSGIEIDHLGGAPGVHSARWASDGDWIPRVLRELEGVAPPDRTCRYVCAAAAVWPDGREAVVRGVVEGVVADSPRGAGGFGYDPIVAPVEGDGRTFAEMTGAEKHAISHRARAFRALAPDLTPDRT
jgi:XTP/dITP diphosphohydrolase